jgi:hypothetical protein
MVALSLATAIADDRSERTYPSLPGAISEPPEWLKKDAPFEATEFFDPIASKENAAPLYLDALYEFAPVEMQDCVSPLESEVRGPALREREQRMFALQRAGGDATVRAALLEEYRQAFESMARAQERKRCVFEVGYSLNTKVHHAQAARAVVRLLDWRVELAVAEKRISAALDDIEMALRLSRDLRPRGSWMAQLCSVAVDSITAQNLIPRVLASPNMTIADCDRLLKLLAAHDMESVDLLAEGFRAGYVFCRDLLHRLEKKEKMGDLVGAPGSSNGIVIASELVNGDKSLEVADQIDGILANMTETDFASEVDALNRYFGPLVHRGNRPSRNLDQLLPEQQNAFDEMRLLPLLNGLLPAQLGLVEALRRDKTRMGATQCLIALRRWHLMEPKRQPPELLAVCKAAGMETVPVDEYSSTGQPLRWTMIAGEYIIYSVAKDGQDDKAKSDWQFGQNPGDWPFMLPKVQEP